MAKPPTRQTRNSQLANDTSTSQLSNDTANMPISATDLIKHDDFLAAVKNAVKEAVREEMKVIREELSMISTRVDLNESRILSLEISNDKKTTQIGDMESKLTDHSERIQALERKLEDSEQYSRRNCVRIFGIPERKGEKTDDIVLTIAKEKLGIDIDINDIDRSHRTGYIYRNIESIKHL